MVCVLRNDMMLEGLKLILTDAERTPLVETTYTLYQMIMTRFTM